MNRAILIWKISCRKICTWNEPYATQASMVNIDKLKTTVETKTGNLANELARVQAYDAFHLKQIGKIQILTKECHILSVTNFQKQYHLTWLEFSSTDR